MRDLLLLRYHRLRNGLRSQSTEGRWRLLVGTLLLLGVGAGLFWGFYRAFFFLQGFLGMGQILIERLLYLFTFTIFALLIFSNAIISFQLHFRAEETAFLHSLPVSAAVIYRFLLLESSILSTAAAGFFILPVTLAYSLTHPDISWPALILLFFFAAGLAALAALIGALISAQIPRVISSPFFRKIAIAAVILSALALPLRRALLPRRPEADRSTLMINQLLDHSRITLSPIFPGYWAAKGFISAGRGNISSALGFLAVLGVNILLGAEILGKAGGNPYFRTWADYQSQGRKSSRIWGLLRKGRRKIRVGGKVGILPPAVRALLTKDLRTFLRDPAQWLQVVILVGLLVVYIFNIRYMPGEVEEPFWKNLITFFNLGTTSLILATLTTRLIFPAFSLERKTFWILGPAPLRRKTIFRVRFWGGYAAALLIALPLITLSNQILEVSPEMTALTSGAMVLISAVLVGLATGLGALFPDYEADNPARIASGFGGTICLVLSLIYIAVTVGLLAGIGHLSNQAGALGSSTLISWALGIVLFLSLAGVLLPYQLGIRALERSEF